MIETIKATVITCSHCGFEQFYEFAKKYKVCPSCNHVLVMRTASSHEIKNIKAELEQMGMHKPDFSYSDYRTYSLTVEDVKELKKISREKKTKAAERHKAAKSKKMFRLLH